ncbi:MAG: hypothetical protein IJF28_00200 [Firmicutes bacterium]|nr:hypothetical protein [Bacillota bacterium]
MTEINYDVYIMSQKEKRDVAVVSYTTSIIVQYLYYNTPLVILTSVPVIFFAFTLFRDYKCRKRKELLSLQFRDLLYSLSSSFGAGRHLEEAIVEGRNTLALMYDSDSPMIAELENMIKRFELSKESEEDMLLDLGMRSGINDIRSFAEIYMISKTTGADIVRVIEITSRNLIDKMTIVREIEAYVAQKRFEGRVIGIMPVFIVFFLRIIAPEYLQPLYSGFSGRMVMTVSLMMTLSGFIMSDKITDISIWDDKTFKAGEGKENKKERGRRCKKTHTYGTSRIYKQACSFIKCRTCFKKRDRDNC